jgi:hypothetical protein
MFLCNSFGKSIRCFLKLVPILCKSCGNMQIVVSCIAYFYWVAVPLDGYWSDIIVIVKERVYMHQWFSDGNRESMEAIMVYEAWQNRGLVGIIKILNLMVISKFLTFFFSLWTLGNRTMKKWTFWGRVNRWLSAHKSAI